MNYSIQQAYRIMNAVNRLGAKKASKKYGRKTIMIALSEIRKYLNIQIAYRTVTAEMKIAAQERSCHSILVSSCTGIDCSRQTLAQCLQLGLELQRTYSADEPKQLQLASHYNQTDPFFLLSSKPPVGAFFMARPNPYPSIVMQTNFLIFLTFSPISCILS